MIKEQLKRMRTALNAKNLKDMCNKLDISDTTISSWRKRKYIPEKHILKCSKLSNYRVEWLLTGEGEEKDNQDATPQIELKLHSNKEVSINIEISGKVKIVNK